VGALLGLVEAKLLASIILMMNTFDVLAFSGGVALVPGATVVASVFPARRASRVNVSTVLRYD
jgi:ABC-type antimicrobial peptide transport system permease subunit